MTPTTPRTAATAKTATRPPARTASRSSRSSFRWRLRQVMADREMFATSDLAPLLIEQGIDLSPAQIYRLVTTAPERLNMQILVALCDALDVTPNDLIQLHDPTTHPATDASSVDSADADGARARRRGPAVPANAPTRPTRARITPDPS